MVYEESDAVKGTVRIGKENLVSIFCVKAQISVVCLLNLFSNTMSCAESGF